MDNKELLFSVVKAYSNGVPDCIVVVVPKAVRLRIGAGKGTRFQVKVDERNRLIYEPISVLEPRD